MHTNEIFDTFKFPSIFDVCVSQAPGDGYINVRNMLST